MCVYGHNLIETLVYAVHPGPCFILMVDEPGTLKFYMMDMLNTMVLPMHNRTQEGLLENVLKARVAENLAKERWTGCLCSSINIQTCNQ